MRSKWIVVVLVLVMAASAVVRAGAEDASAPKDVPVERISMSTIVQPNELRGYKVSVGIQGCIGVDEDKPLVVDALNTLRVLHKYGRREGDNLLQLEISALDVQAIINGEKSPASPDQFPRLTLLLDKAWRVNRIFGIEGTRYAGQVPGLNYANLILLFFVPDADKPHAIGESWTSTLKTPGRSDGIKVTNTIKSRGETEGVKTLTVRQDYVWNEMKLDGDRTVKATAVVDSVLDAVTGKLIKSHAECQLLFSEPSQSKPENRQYKATTRIDISLEK